MNIQPYVRPRRLRQSQAMRRMVREVDLHPASLILPVFVREGLAADSVPIESMPGVNQYSLQALPAVVEQCVEAGLGGVMLFGVPEDRDATGTGAIDPDGILNRAIAVARATSRGGIVVQSDLCLDEFTNHGHCGVLSADGEAGGDIRVDNDATLELYGQMAVAQAIAGAEVLGLSGMMDGQVAAVRDALDDAGFTDVVILAYAAKYASAFYGPFRDAVESTLEGDRRTYQMDPPNGREAIREIALDIDEGADIVMVKPAGPYLDVVAAAAELSPVPVWAYQVSGEYAMVEAAAERGWIDRERAIWESLIGIRRAGADAVLTYWALEVAGWLNEGRDL